MKSCVLGAFVLLTACATAQPTDPSVVERVESAPSTGVARSGNDVQRYVDYALRLYDQHAYAEAAAAFEVAYSRAPEPSLLFARAQALRLAGACERARPLYDRFLAETPDPTSQAAIVRIADDCR